MIVEQGHTQGWRTAPYSIYLGGDARARALSQSLLAYVAAHIENFTQHGDDDLLFIRPKNGPLRRPKFTGVRRRLPSKPGSSVTKRPSQSHL